MRYGSFNGEILRTRRIELGYSPIEVYERTRIPVSCLDAMERSNMAALPPACYTVGFLRSYCEFLGIEPGPLIRAYTAKRRPSHRVLLDRSTHICEWLASARMSVAMTWVIVCAVFAFGWLAYYVVVQSQAEVDNVEASTVDMIEAPEPLSLERFGY